MESQNDRLNADQDAYDGGEDDVKTRKGRCEELLGKLEAKLGGHD